MLGEISGHVSVREHVGQPPQTRHSEKLAVNAKRARVLPAVADYTVIIGDTLSTLALGDRAYEIGLLFKIVQPKNTSARACRGELADQRMVRHPELGDVTVGLALSDNNRTDSTGCVAVVDKHGTTLLVQDVAIYGSSLEFADPASRYDEQRFHQLQP
ncbi:hypothetical protein DFR67_103464 [Williamsia limnetica]|uniref:Uncharacterized protein n=1 Tax=Williamsia limnetica TaxID=882452 RepID=A0A318RPK5_WILLI|nr:hypothetical protein [Williamsia limnetica]PYE19551.1 hypothetical protein DFR67_103464 [Williamsia limnetica]